jgi:hypothetical protein
MSGPRTALQLSVVLMLAPTHTAFLLVAGEPTVVAPLSPSLPAAKRTVKRKEQERMNERRDEVRRGLDQGHQGCSS